MIQIELKKLVYKLQISFCVGLLVQEIQSPKHTYLVIFQKKKSRFEKITKGPGSQEPIVNNNQAFVQEKRPILNVFVEKCPDDVSFMGVLALQILAMMYLYTRYLFGIITRLQRLNEGRNGSTSFDGRDKWTLTRQSVVCSKHFTEDCFLFGSATVEKYKTPRLKRD